MANLLKGHLQSELDDSHGPTEIRDLADTRRIRYHRRGAHKAEVVRLPEIRCIERIEELTSELRLHSFGNGEVLDNGSVQVALSRRYQNIPACTSVMAQVRAVRDVTAHSLERGWIEPLLPARI